MSLRARILPTARIMVSLCQFMNALCCAGNSLTPFADAVWERTSDSCRRNHNTLLHVCVSMITRRVLRSASLLLVFVEIQNACAREMCPHHRLE